MAIDEPARSPASRFLGTVLRIILVAVIGVALGAGAYFGLPLAYRGLVAQVRLNADRIDGLQQELERTRSDLTELSGRSADRMAELEADNAAARESLAELQASFEVDLAALERELDSLGSQAQALDQALGTQTEQLVLAGEAPTEANSELLRELSITRALLHLVRARLWLIENNLGLASEELQHARAALAGIEGVEPAVGRLDQALAEIDSTPLVAADDLEIAWQLLTAEP